MMKEGMQDLLLAAGKTACYVLCIIRISEQVNGKDSDVVRDIQRLIDAKLVTYEKGNNFYVADAGACLTLLTGKKYKVREEAPGYKAKPGEHLIERWVLGKGLHFQMSDWRPMMVSNTVNTGKLQSYRVLAAV